MNAAVPERSYLRSGALAGAASAVVVVTVHYVLISNIWYSAPITAGAGAVCGLSVAWTYGMLFEAGSALSWLRYNLLYVAMFLVLGAVSVLVYEPQTTIAALVEANEPPGELIRQAMPLTVRFTLGTAMSVSALFGRTRRDFGAILLTCTVLILLLGLNVSVIGFIAIPNGSLYVVRELFGLIATLNLAYVAIFIALERESLAVSLPPRDSVRSDVQRSDR